MLFHGPDLHLFVVYASGLIRHESCQCLYVWIAMVVRSGNERGMRNLQSATIPQVIVCHRLTDPGEVGLVASWPKYRRQIRLSAAALADRRTRPAARSLLIARR